MNILSIKDLTIEFHTRNGVATAVNNISFDLPHKKILGIVGESGSGKSVTCYSLLGLIPMPPGKIVSGEAIFEGKNLFALKEKELRDIRGNKISMVFQDPMTSLNPYMTVGAQIIEALRVHEKMDKKVALKRAIEALDEVGIREPEKSVHKYPHEYSGGMRQRVMIAMALATEPDILIADEPTTALDVTIQKQILDLLRDIQSKRDLSIIFITHDLAVIHSLADHVLVMEKGNIVERGEPADIFQRPSHPYTQKLIAAIPNSAKPESYKASVDSEALLSVSHLNTKYPIRKASLFGSGKEYLHVVKDISLTINKGEILGLVGESGSGKSSFGKTIMRLVDSESGNVLLDGTEILGLTGDELTKSRRDYQMIFQDPYASLNPRMTILDTLSEALLTHNIVPQEGIYTRVAELIVSVGLDERSLRKYPHEFSGGQRQRIAIARAIAVEPKLIVADEAVSALDVTIKAQVLELLLNLTKKYNLTMLFISHDLSVVRYVCDRVAVMQFGEILEVGETESLFAHPQHEYTQRLLKAIPTIPEHTA